MSMIHRFLSFCLLFVSSGILPAAEICFLPWDEEIAERKLALSDGSGVWREIQYMHPHSRGEIFKIPAGKELSLSTLDRESKEGIQPSLPIQLPSGSTKALFLLVPDAEHPTGLRIIAMDDDLKTFGWGSIRVLNTTGRPLYLTWEKSYLQLPEKADPVDIRPGGRTRNMEVMLFLEKSDKRPLYSAVWEHDENLRTFLIITPGKDLSLGLVDFRFVTEDRRATRTPTEP